MKRIINRIKLYVNDDQKSQEVAKFLKMELEKYQFSITNKQHDLVISVGGDGTFLHMMKSENFNNEIYYVGINSGTLGFLQEIDIQGTLDFVERLQDNNFKVERLSIQETIIQSLVSEKFYSLNEIVLRKENFSILKTPVFIDNELLENFTGDGLLISTSTGSTAYNMAFGGSIIYNSLKALSLTPIAPLNNRAYKTLTNPIIVPDNKEIKIVPKKKTDLFLMIDGENIIRKNVSMVKTKVSRRKIKCLRMQDFHFIKVVNTKILKGD